MPSNDSRAADSGSSASTTSGSILAINSGSSSVKFGLFTMDPEPRALCRGTVDTADRNATLQNLFARISANLETAPLIAIGHRIVHGGPDLARPALVTVAVI